LPAHEFEGAIPETSSHRYSTEETAQKAFKELYQGLEGDYDFRELGEMDAIYGEDDTSPVATRDGKTLTLLDEEAEETLRGLGYELEV
jgi:hypothetical protein